jgi:aromatic ring hydroxylase
MDPAMFDSIRQGFGNNIRNYYQHMRSNDIFASHTVTNPQGWRPLGPADNQRHTPPTLRVINEDDSGVTINGLKMLGTASVFCHETWCGNLQPVAAGQEKESITVLCRSMRVELAHCIALIGLARPDAHAGRLAQLA